MMLWCMIDISAIWQFTTFSNEMKYVLSVKETIFLKPFIIIVDTNKDRTTCSYWDKIQDIFEGDWDFFGDRFFQCT